MQVFCVNLEKYEEIVFTISCIKCKKMKNENSNISRVICVKGYSFQSTYSKIKSAKRIFRQGEVCSTPVNDSEFNIRHVEELFHCGNCMTSSATVTAEGCSGIT